MAEPVATPQAVNLVDERTGEVVNVNEADLPKLGAGYRLASDEEVAKDLERQQYGEGFGSEAAAFGEGALSGATLGLSDVAARAISPEYAAELAKRREYNPTAAGLGEGAGILGATLLTGGAGGAAAGAAEGGGLLARGAGALARAATAPTRALVGLGEAVTAGTGRLLGAEAATSVLGQAARQAAAYGAGGATEGALFGAAKAATDDFLNDHEITAERILAGAATGGLTGGVLGAGIGGGSVLLEKAAEGVKNTVWPSLKKAIAADGSFDDFVGERAYKAALGGRNLKDVQRSERYGGPAEIGETLLREGVVTPKSTIEDIAKVAAEKAAERGTRIGEIVDELDAPAEGLGHVTAARPDGRALWSRIESDVIAPLKASPVKRDVGEAIENRLGYLKEALTREDAPPIKFRDLWELRRDLDDRMRWDQAPAPYAAPNPTLEGMRDVRRTFEDYWQDMGDAAAQSIGRDTLMADFRAAKRDYAQLKHAEEIATKAIARDSANRMLSPSDYGVGAMVAGADAITGGGAGLGSLAYGLASGAVHKFFRERGNAMFAGTMYALRGAPKLVKDARAGEQLAEAAGKGFIDKALTSARYLGERVKNTAAAAGARRLSSPEALEQATRKAAELTDPNSPQRQEMQRRTAAVRVQYPALGAAMDQKTQQVADFLKSKAGPISSTPAAGDPFGHLRKPRQNPAKAEKLARYVDAATNPRGALERISEGELVREDVEVLQQLYPRLYQRVRDEVLMNLSSVDTLPSYDARLKLGILLGSPTDPSMRPAAVQALQQVAQAGRAQQGQAQAQGAPQAGPVGEPVLSPSNRREPRLGKMYATKTDAQSVEGSRLGG
jgi:hypothetical protein